ncbi:hypothetical protein [Microbacterium sp.]|uniref:hypothetical protein n=1 Tax=Microbacterium sp. TaxID=51671 RepID=UPI0039E4A23A
MRRALTAVLAAVVTLCVCACAPAAESDPRPVTTAESELLAAMRFKNFDAGTRPFTTTVVEQGTSLHLNGWVDYASHTGYAAVTGEGFEPQALLWTADTVAIRPAAPDDAGLPVLPIPALSDQTWTSRTLQADASALDATLALIGNLGADRPENPLLVQQTGALWLREDEIDGTAVTVFAAPPSDEVVDADTLDPDESPLRLWLDESGLLRRAQVRQSDFWYDIDFGLDPGPALAVTTDG